MVVVGRGTLRANRRRRVDGLNLGRAAGRRAVAACAVASRRVSPLVTQPQKQGGAAVQPARAPPAPRPVAAHVPRQRHARAALAKLVLRTLPTGIGRARLLPLLPHRTPARPPLPRHRGTTAIVLHGYPQYTVNDEHTANILLGTSVLVGIISICKLAVLHGPGRLVFFYLLYHNVQPCNLQQVLKHPLQYIPCPRLHKLLTLKTKI